MSELLVDTNVWVDYLRGGDADLSNALLNNRILGHVLVTGEIAMGNLADRTTILGLLHRLPQAVQADDGEVLALVEQRQLFGLGLGFIDAHLLAATLLTPNTRLWTRDKRLRNVAERLGIAGEASL